MYDYDGISAEILTIAGKEYEITQHAKEKMQDRKIEMESIVEVLSNWVAKKFKPEHNSTSYYKMIKGQTQLLMVAVSENELKITTLYLDRTATRNYQRGGYSYFDETRNETESRI